MSETRRPDRAVMATGEGERVGDWQTEAATSRSAPPDGEAATPDALGVALDRVLQVTTDLARAMATVIDIPRSLNESVGLPPQPAWWRPSSLISRRNPPCEASG